MCPHDSMNSLRRARGQRLLPDAPSEPGLLGLASSVQTPKGSLPMSSGPTGKSRCDVIQKQPFEHAIWHRNTGAARCADSMSFEMRLDRGTAHVSL
jgi:hypothetical protein